MPPGKPVSQTAAAVKDLEARLDRSEAQVSAHLNTLGRAVQAMSHAEDYASKAIRGLMLHLKVTPEQVLDLANDEEAAEMVAARDALVRDGNLVEIGAVTGKGDTVTLSFAAADGAPQHPPLTCSTFELLRPEIQGAIMQRVPGDAVPFPGDETRTITVVAVHRTPPPATPETDRPAPSA